MRIFQIPLLLETRRAHPGFAPKVTIFATKILLGCALSFCACNMQAGKSHYILAERLFNDRKYSAAVVEFQKIIEEDPKGPLAQQALFRIGLIQYLYLENYSYAIETFGRFIVLSQNIDLVYQAEKSIGEIYFSKLEDYKQAIQQYEKLLQKYPRSPENDFFILRKAKSYYSILEFKKAIQTYQELISANPKSTYVVEAFYQIGNTHFTSGNCELAIKAFKEVTEKFSKSPQFIFAEFGIGNCFEELEKWDEAQQIYTKILDRYPTRKVVESKIKNLEDRKKRKLGQ